jgi:hypothetical protein
MDSVQMACEELVKIDVPGQGNYHYVGGHEQPVPSYLLLRMADESPADGC